jgi:pyridoxine 4-dehydrogenase
MSRIGLGTAPLAFTDISAEQAIATVHAGLDRENSLRALGVDRIGLYLLHHVDPAVPLPESVGALRELRDAGKIAEIGLSNVSIAQIEQARAEAPITTVQNRLSISHRDDRPTVGHCAGAGLRYQAYMPLSGPDDPSTATRLGVSPAQLKLAWVLAQGPHVTALVGASRPATISDSAGADRIVLDPADLVLLDR